MKRAMDFQPLFPQRARPTQAQKSEAERREAMATQVREALEVKIYADLLPRMGGEDHAHFAASCAKADAADEVPPPKGPGQ